MVRPILQKHWPTLVKITGYNLTANHMARVWSMPVMDIRSYIHNYLQPFFIVSTETVSLSSAFHWQLLALHQHRHWTLSTGSSCSSRLSNPKYVYKIIRGMKKICNSNLAEPRQQTNHTNVEIFFRSSIIQLLST